MTGVKTFFFQFFPPLHPLHKNKQKHSALLAANQEPHSHSTKS
jgi:hypothetical protein